MTEFLATRARRIERALLNKGWTRTQLAKEAGYSERTIRNLLNGQPVNDQTVVDVCQALGIKAELEDQAETVDVADARYGSYARASYRNYEGCYFAYRRGFSDKNNIVRTLFEITWSSYPKCLIFNEYHTYFRQGPVSHDQSGHVHISTFTNMVHLVTSHEGAVRLITLMKMRDDKIMRGGVLSQCDRDLYYQPCLSGIFLRKIENFDEDVHKNMVGPMEPSHADYESANRELIRVETNIMNCAILFNPPSGDAALQSAAREPSNAS